MPRRNIPMLGASPRTQRSASTLQLPTDFSPAASAAPTFTYRKELFHVDLRKYENAGGDYALPEEIRKTQIKEMIHKRWEAAKEVNAFNYALNCMYKCLDGKYDLSVQLNVERGELRRKPMRFRNIREPFNPVRFNFTKLHDNEVMLYLKCEDNPITTDPLDRHLIAVNASPLERDHCLIIPAVNKCLPQVLTPVAIKLAVDIMLTVTDSDFHILFNSLLGQASVNHLHMHALYWPYESDLINRRFEQLADVEGVYIIQPPMWLCSAFAFQLTRMEDYEKFKSDIFKCVNFLTEQNQAHNLFFTRAQPIRVEGPDRVEDRRGEKPLYVTLYVFPRQNIVGAKPPSNFNPAANELAGCLTSYTIRFFESVTEQAVFRIIEEEALLPTSVFQNLCCDLSDVYNSRPLGTSRESKTSLLDGLSSPEIDELRDTFESFNQPRSPSVRLKNPLSHTTSVDDQVVRFEIHSAD